MAKIQKTNDQEKALELINEGIKNVEMLNTVLEMNLDDLTVMVSGKKNGKTVKSQVAVDKKGFIKLVESQKKSIVKTIENLSKEQNIVLDDKEKVILGFIKKEKVVEPVKVEDKVEEVKSDDILVEVPGTEETPKTWY